MDQNQETQAVESSLLSEWEITFFPIFHSHIHSCPKVWGKYYNQCAQESGQHLDSGGYVRHG